MNKIIEENEILEGRADKSYWDVPHSTLIEGFATDMSVNSGARVDFKINVDGGAGSDYKVEIFRLGYYGGSGAREVAEWTNTNATVQPDALVDASRGTVDAGNWSVTDSWNVPADAVSGVYLARLQRLDSNGNPIDGAVNQVPFVVRNDGETHDIVLQTSDTTWQAYNAWGGNNGVVGANLYGDANGSINWDPIPGAGSNSQDRAYAVSYNRPFITDDGTGQASGPQDYLFGADYSAIYWLEEQGYDVSYISGVDTDRLGADYLKNYKSFISVGHDEYWSGDQRANVEEARDAGVNLLFWSGNECYWKVRWDTAYSADGTPYRTLVCYKETLAVADPGAGPGNYYNLDPSDIWTGTWMDTRFLGNPAAGGGNLQDIDPLTELNPACHCGQNQLTGQLFGPDGAGQFGGALDVPSNYASLRVWRDTTIADGGQLDIAPGILGYEWDTSPNDALRPAGLIKLSETTLPWNAILTDQGNSTDPGVATHTLSLYRTASGSLVFGAGTTFWTWGLSDQHDSSPYGADIANLDIQQFTINMFADMGIQPGVADAILISQGLKRASASTDTAPAVASIDDLPDTIEAQKLVTITGTATDNDGNPLTADGKVAAVEVSLDGGSTWKVANSTDGWATWNYLWYPTKQGSYTIKARALDDSLNINNVVPASDVINVTPSSTFSAFNGATPGAPGLNNDQTPIEVGMRFAVDRSGSVTELKYWRGSGDAIDTDVREGHLWRADGTLLATVTFTSGLGQAGWQVATLSSPVTLAAGVQYIASYRTNDNYVATTNYFVNANDVAFDGLDNDSFWGHGGVVRVVQDGAGGTNGVFHYGSGAAVMPSESFNGSNFWVDISFDANSAPSNTAPVITSAAALTSPENRLTVGTITATDADNDHLGYAIAGGADAALFTIDAQTGLLRFVNTPNYEAPADAGGNNVYDLIVSVADGIAPAVIQAITVAVTDLAETGATGSNVFGSTDAPTTTETVDPTDYELGMRFTANAAGTITELRYFRGAADANNSDTRILNLWNAAGSRLGSVTVTSTAGESGWQVGTLSAPIAIQAGATYIVSYGTTQNYVVSANYFTTAHTGPDGVLTAGAASGVFADGTPGVFPTASYNASNYWADVTFVPSNTTNNNAPVITSAAALTSPENRLSAGMITATDADSNPLAYAIAGGADAALFTIDAQTGLLKFVNKPNYEAPADAGANNVYDLTVSVGDGIAPAVTKDITVTVTDRDENGTGSNVFDENDAPTTTETGDTTDYELGMRFTANAAGTITELRYFRGVADANDTDTRVLNLWNVAGSRLGSVTVTSTAGESGWQVGTLSAPIAIQAGATYVVSYGTTQNYAITANYFTTAHAGPDGVLTAGAASGVFADGTPGVFPTASYNASNYWADVTFVPGTAPVITSAAALTSPENRLTVGTVTATDADSNPLAYAIAGGADAALFTIDAQTGLLSFVSTPNYEAPADAGANNVYDLTVSVGDGIVPAVTKDITVTVTDLAENGTGSNVFGLTDAPTTTQTADPGDYELGMRFTANAAGTITELRYFRGAADANDTDTRVLNLWDAAGSPLGSVTVTSSAGESGWQVGTLSAPIEIQAGATYVVSYGTTQNYAVTTNYFTTAHAGPDGVLTAGPASGVFADGTPGVFPTASYNGSNYWADVTFVPTINSAPAFTSPATASAAENQLVAATLTATDANNSDTLTYAIAGGADAARFTVNAATGVLSFVSAPDFEAPADTGANNVYDVTVSVSDGHAPAVAQTLAVAVTNVAENTGSSVFSSMDAPATTETADFDDYELGMKFTANESGTINELRYFRGAADSNDDDTRTLNLWAGNGVQIGSVSVTSTIGQSGWQVGTLSAPVTIEAGATYVVSYGTTQNYVLTGNYFATAHAGPDGMLTAGAASGVFAAGATGNFPTQTYNNANYWVDVNFISGTPNRAPAFTSPGTASAAENQLVAAALTATDADNDALTYAIVGGVDAARFTVDAQTGVLSFVSAPDFEAPADAGANNVYDITVSVRDTNAATVTQALAITVTDTSEAPTIAPIAAPNTNEDVTNPAQIDLLTGATDPEGNTISVLSPVTVTSSNAARTVAFTVSPAGVLSVDPAQFGDLDAGQSELLTVSYQISDGVNDGVSNTATITVEGRHDNRAPVFTSPATASVAEDQLVVTTITASDADSDALTYAITGGADAARFTINASTGVLGFFSAINFEAPVDAGADNVYDVTVSVSDGNAAAVAQALAITVTDINEAPTIAPIAVPNTNEDVTTPVQINLLAGATDSEGNTITVLSPVTVTSSNTARTVAFTVSPAGVLSVDPAQFGELDAGQSELLTVSYLISDGVNAGVSNTATITVEGRRDNRAPVYTSPATASVAEDQLVVTTLTASDADSDALTYAITGGADAARFTINASTGVLGFFSAINFEAPVDAGADNVYDVTVSVSDGNAAAVAQALAITVTDINEAPTIAPIAVPNTNEDVTTPVQINLLAGATDSEGNTITVLSPVTVTSSNTARTVAFTVSAGVLSFNASQFGTLNAGQSELLTVSYRISDGVNAGVLNTATITVEGRDENQTINGNFFGNTLTGAGGNDTINGLQGDDTISGNGGNDTINGGADDDSIDAGAGDDVILISASEADFDTMVGGLGNDTVRIAGTADAVLTGTSQMTGIEVFDGSNRSLRGTDSTNTFNFGAYTLTNLFSILALGGNDTVIGSAGADVINGGSGTDSINGGAGNDTIQVTGTEAQSDTMVGGDGIDTLQIIGTNDLTLAGTSTITGFETLNGGGQSILGTSSANIFDLSIFATVTNLDGVQGLGGDDTLIGSSFADQLDGGSGNDTLNGGAGTDTAAYGSATLAVTVSLAVTGAQNTGGAGNDTLIGIENLTGSSFNDTLIGDGSANALSGGAGNDTLDGGAGNDTLDGGAATDTATYASAASAVTVGLAVSGAQTTGGSGSDTLVGIENLTGSGFNDTLTGDGSANTLSGGAGNDTLDGGTGNDTLDGGTGTDTAAYGSAASAVTVSLAVSGAQNTSGSGSDTLIGIENLMGSDFDDTLTGNGNANTLDGGAGTDTAAYGSAASAVTVSLAVSGAQNTGGAGSDTLVGIENLTGSSFNDTLIGDGNANTLTGGAGNDTLNGGAGSDTAAYGSATLAVTVSLAVSGAQNTGSAGSDTLVGIENLMGSSFNDTLTGDGNANTLTGGLGNDTLNGGAGNDTAAYASATSAVTVSLAVSGAQNTGGAGSDTLIGIENLMGSSFNDTLTGDGNANTLTGGAGNDTLIGGAGNDTLVGADGQDAFLFNTSLTANVDTVADFNASNDTIRLDDDIFTTLSTGTLSTAVFFAGAAAHDSTDRIIYNSATGNLFYDRDGTGSTAAMQFAHLDGTPTISNTNFVVVS